MEEIPDNDDCEPRTRGKSQRLTLNSGLLLLLFFPHSVPDLILLFVLLIIALISSVTRASLSASAALETPWIKKSQGKVPGRKERFALLIIQYVAMLSAWLVAAGLFLTEFDDPATALYSFLALVCIWLVLDAVLRWYGTKHAEALSGISIISPAIGLLAPVGTFFLKVATFLGVAKDEDTADSTDSSDGENADIIEEKELLLGVASIGKTTAREAMVSKSNIKAFSIDLDFHELMDMVNKFGYSRIPVYRHNLDDIEGVLYIKDLLPYIQQDEQFRWQDLIRAPYLIPETKRLDGLLDEFQERRVHMAIVIDEYGSTRGLITLEDIIEEIFGEISDEHDDENENKFIQLDPLNYLFEGQALLNDVIRNLELDNDYFADSRIESETLAGLILELFTRVPRTGEEVIFKDLTFRVQAATKKQIRKVRVTLPGEVEG